MEEEFKEYGLGRLPSPFDPRDWRLASFEAPNYLKAAQSLTEVQYDFPLPSLNQERTGHCVGFSGAAFGIASPVNQMYNNEIGHKFYYMCKEIDGEPTSEDGSYVRSMAKVLKNIGRIEAYAFAFSIAEINWWLMNRGSVIAGTIWTEGMFKPDAENMIHVTGSVQGGHAYLLIGIKIVNGVPCYVIQNSWGDAWGVKGQAYISIADFELIFKYNGEAMTAVELPLDGVVEKQECFLITLLEQLFKK